MVVDRRRALRRLEERLRERLPGDELGEDPAAGAVRVDAGEAVPVLEDEASRPAELRSRAVDHHLDVVRSGYFPAKTTPIIPPIEVLWT